MSNIMNNRNKIKENLSNVSKAYLEYYNSYNTIDEMSIDINQLNPDLKFLTMELIKNIIDYNKFRLMYNTNSNEINLQNEKKEQESFVKDFLKNLIKDNIEINLDNNEEIETAFNRINNSFGSNNSPPIPKRPENIIQETKDDKPPIPPRPKINEKETNITNQAKDKIQAAIHISNEEFESNKTQLKKQYEKIEGELNELNKNYKAIPTKAYGNCLFDALIASYRHSHDGISSDDLVDFEETLNEKIYNFTKEIDSHDEESFALRQILIEHIEKENNFNKLGGQGETLNKEEWINSMKQNNYWGDNIIICAFSDKYKINIKIVNGTNKQYISQCPPIDNSKNVYLGLVSLSGGEVGNHFVGIGQIFNQSGGMFGIKSKSKESKPSPTASEPSHKPSRLVKNLAIKAYLGYDIQKENEETNNKD